MDSDTQSVDVVEVRNKAKSVKINAIRLLLSDVSNQSVCVCVYAFCAACVDIIISFIRCLWLALISKYSGFVSITL